MQGFSLESIRKMAEEKITVAVDGVVSRIPNGQQYTDQVHQAITNVLNDLQKQAQAQMGNMGNMGNMLGGMTGRQPNQPNPPTH